MCWKSKAQPYILQIKWGSKELPMVYHHIHDEHGLPSAPGPDSSYSAPYIFQVSRGREIASSQRLGGITGRPNLPSYLRKGRDYPSEPLASHGLICAQAHWPRAGLEYKVLTLEKGVVWANRQTQHSWPMHATPFESCHWQGMTLAMLKPGLAFCPPF